ncbi:MAG: DTW domain-containing protein [OM182 bacterium]|nr:DTW domain-containing protein [OM182 bacterium]
MIKAKRQTCQQCAKPLSTCYCHLIEKKANAWPVCLIQHLNESSHAKGTARIAQLSLKNLRTIQLGDREPFTPPENDSDSWCHPVLIYPNSENRDIAELVGTSPRPLIVLDGTWRKSKAMLLSSSYLQSLSKYSFETERPSRYRIRKASSPDFLSTLESIVAILETLEGTGNDYAQMLEVMDWMVTTQLGFINSTNP